MAREAGGRAQQNKNCDVEYVMSSESLQRLIDSVRADEREACAKVADRFVGADQIAAAIRARGQA